MKFSTKIRKRVSLITTLAIMANIFLIGGLQTSAQTEVDLTFDGLISNEEIAAQGHVAISDKLSDQLDAIEYINEDGTRTVYSFPVPIKYIDDSGDIQPINNKLHKKLLQNKWTNSANRFDITIDGNINDGVALAYDDVSLQSTVNVAASSIKVDSSSSGVTEDKYVDFTGIQSKISLTPTNTGYATHVHLDNFSKDETIVLDVSSNGIERHYVTDAGKAVFEMEDGSSIIYSALTYALGEGSASWPKVNVSIQSSGADLKLVYIVERDDVVAAAESLEMTINSDIEYATANDGIMLLDFGTEVPDTNHYDAGVYSNNASINYGSSDRFLVGQDATMGVCRAYIKFGLSVINNLDLEYDQILSANYRIRELTGYTTAFQAEAYMTTGSWSESAITWNSKPAYKNERLTAVNVEWASNTLGMRGYYDFYITSALMAWLQGVSNNGVMLKSRTENNGRCRAFASREHASYIPRLYVKYSIVRPNMDNVGIVDNTLYYIKNKRSGLYLTNPSKNTESNVTQTTFTGSVNQRWKIKATGNTSEYYTLTPQNNTNLYLNCPSVFADSFVQVSSFDSGYRFKFIRNWDGSYQIVTGASNNTYVLKAENNSTTSGSNIIQATHTTDWTKSDDWTLEKVEKGMADIFSFSSEYYGLETAEPEEGFETQLNAMGYNATNYVDEDYMLAYLWLSLDDIWIFSGHGGLSCIDFTSIEDSNNGDFDYITAGDLSGDNYAISDKLHNELAPLQLAVFASCDTGQDDSDNNTNMVGMTYFKGAHFVIAHSDWTTSPDADWWIEYFLYYCSQGYTVYEAMLSADDDLYARLEQEGLTNTNNGNLIQRHCLGDNSLVLCHN